MMKVNHFNDLDFRVWHQFIPIILVECHSKIVNIFDFDYTLIIWSHILAKDR
jgi:hypothetical protein